MATVAVAVLGGCGGGGTKSPAGASSQVTVAPTSASSASSASATSGSATDVVAKKQAPASLATDDPAWSGAATTTVKTDIIQTSKATHPVDVSMQALYNDTDIWFRFSWADTTNDATSVWQWDGTKWNGTVSTTTDRLALYWEINPISDFEARGCAALCHRGDNETIDKWYMIAPNAGDMLENWQWTASTSAPMGQANNLDLVSTHDASSIESSIVAQQQAAGGGGTVSNTNATNDGPKMMQDPTITSPLYGPNYLAVTEAVTLDMSKIKPGDKVPKTMLAPWTGDRGDIETKTTYANGKYTVVFHRKLNTGQTDDVTFKPGSKYTFGLAVWDALDQQNHTVTNVAYHLVLQ